MTGFTKEAQDFITTSINVITFGGLSRDEDLKEDILDILKTFKLLVIYIGILGLLISFSLCNISYLSFLPFIDLINMPIIKLFIEYLLVYTYTNIIQTFIGDTIDNILPSYIKNNYVYLTLFFIYKTVPLMQISNITDLFFTILSKIPIVNTIPFNLIKSIIKYIIMAVLFILSTINLTSINFLNNFVAQRLIDKLSPPSWIVTGLKETNEFSFLR